MSTTFRERIDSILKEFHLTRAEFERMCNLSNGYTRNLGGTPGSGKLEKILTAFPQINRLWLLNGEGEMLCGNINQHNISGTNVGRDNIVNQHCEDLLQMIKSQGETITKQAEQMDRLISVIEKLTSK